jgi:hypothetical protein
VIVTCARCLAEYREDDPEIRLSGDGWACVDESACIDRVFGED